MKREVWRGTSLSLSQAQSLAAQFGGRMSFRLVSGGVWIGEADLEDFDPYVRSQQAADAVGKRIMEKQLSILHEATQNPERANLLCDLLGPRADPDADRTATLEAAMMRGQEEAAERMRRHREKEARERLRRESREEVSKNAAALPTLDSLSSRAVSASDLRKSMAEAQAEIKEYAQGCVSGDFKVEKPREATVFLDEGVSIPAGSPIYHETGHFYVRLMPGTFKYTNANHDSPTIRDISESEKQAAFDLERRIQ